MNDVILTVWDKGGNSAVLDLYGQDTISLDFNFNSITTLEPGEVLSQEFRIPATQNNCNLFGLQSDFNLISYNGTTNNIKKKFRAVITVDTVPISEGFVQFKKSFIKNGKMSDFSIVFFGEQVDLGTSLKDVDFTILDYTDAEHIVNFTNCKAVNDGINIGSNDYGDRKLMWTLIDKGQQFMTWPSNLQGTFVDAPYSYGSGPTAFFQPDNIIAVQDLTPCFKLTYLIDKINTYLVGIPKRKIQLSTALQNELDTMCMPFMGKDGNIKYYDDSENGIQFQANQLLDETLSFSVLSGSIYRALCTTTFNEVIDLGSNFNTLTNTYTIPTDGHYQFSFRGTLRAEVGGTLTIPYATVVPGFLINGTDFIAAFNNGISGTINTNGPALPSGTSDYSIEAALNALFLWIPGSTGDTAIAFTTYTAQSITVVNGEIQVPTFNNITGVNSLNSYSFVAGDTIEPCFAAYGDPTNGGAIDIICNITSFDFQKVDLITTSNFSARQMAPEKYQLLDFLRDIIKLTNSVAIPNYSNYGVIDIMTMDEYLSSGGTIDWTNKIDELSEITIVPSSEYQTRKQKFTYSEGSDVANQAYKSVGRLFGTLELYDTDSDFTTGTNNIELVACPTPNQMLNGSSTWNMPKFVDSQYQFTYPGARFLYYNFTDLYHINPAGGIIIGAPDGMDVPFVGQYSDLLPDLSSNDLNFAQEIPLHPIISAPVNTAYLKYYNSYLQELYSAESKVLTAQFNLDVTDILNLNYNDSVFLFNSYWRVLSVQGYNMGKNQSTSVTLIKKLSAVDLPDVCNDTAVAIEKDGSVQWLNGGSQICCEQIGYYWNDALNICYRSQNQGGIKPRPTSPLSSLSNGYTKLFNEQTIKTDPGATGTIVVGKSLTVTGAAKNSIVGGEDLVVQNKGIWYGGGNSGTYVNRSASGQMIWQAKDIFSSAAFTTVVGSFLTLENSIYTTEVILTVSSLNYVGGNFLPVYVYSISTYAIVKNVAGTATGDNPHNLIIDVDPSNIGPFELGWTTNPTNSNIIDLKLKNLRGIYPTPEYNYTAQVRVTQIGTE